MPDFIWPPVPPQILSWTLMSQVSSLLQSVLTCGGVKLKYRASPAGRLRPPRIQRPRAQGASATSGGSVSWRPAACEPPRPPLQQGAGLLACSRSRAKLPASVARSSRRGRRPRTLTPCKRACCRCSNASSVACFSGATGTPGSASLIPRCSGQLFPRSGPSGPGFHQSVLLGHSRLRVEWR